MPQDAANPVAPQWELLYLFLIKVQLIYDVLSSSALKQCDTVIHIHTFFSHVIFHHSLSQWLDIAACAVQQDLIAYPF